MTYRPANKDAEQQATSTQLQTRQKTPQGAFSDNRSTNAQAMQLQAVMHSSTSHQQQALTQLMVRQSGIQPIQKVEEELLQGKFGSDVTAQLAEQENAQPNNTGLPDTLKTGLENLSGMAMDHVKVHYNSLQPAQLNAHAYAQGSDIHVAPGQEQHLPHEAWHVVQQAQGRVQPTMQMKGNVQINDDVGLEAEADAMGAKALAAGGNLQTAQLKALSGSQPAVAQLVRLPPGLYPGPANLIWTHAATKHGHSQDEIIDQIAAGWNAGSILGTECHIPWGEGAPSGIILVKNGDDYTVKHAQSAANIELGRQQAAVDLEARAKNNDTADTSSDWRKKTP